MRILVAGREGQVARAFSALNNPEIDIVCIGRPTLDIRDRLSIDRAIEKVNPHIVVNAAAYTAVDRAENDRETAYAANRDGAGNASAAAAAAGIPIIHISTDYVFSGDKALPYVESDLVSPQGVYGASKLAGELAVATANPAHIIIRTSWIYSVWGNNFLKTMLRLASTCDEIGVVADQRGNPTYAPELVRGIVTAARVALLAPQSTHWRGIFHLSGNGDTVWADFAEAIFEASARGGGDSARVLRICTADYPTAARRPINSCLDSGKFRNVFDFASREWKESVVECIATLNSNPRNA
ncbi:MULTISPECIES: dTDP-4-dehydrorhamnose reductase [unclassified Rhizobium]